MKKSDLVEGYLENIDRQLLGLDQKIKKSVLDELENHIIEKSKMLALKMGKKEPDEEIFKDVINDLGSPYEVTSEYIKTLPKKPDTFIISLLYLQIFIGIFSIIIGSATLFIEIQGDIFSYMEIGMIIGILIPYFLIIFFGFVILQMAITQIWECNYLLRYGNISIGFSFFLGLCSFIIFINRLVHWYYFKVKDKPTDFDELTSLYVHTQNIEAISVSTVLILFLFIFIFGLFRVHRFQKFFAEEVEEYEKEKKMRNVGKEAFIVSYITLIFTMIIVNIFMFFLIIY